MATTTRLTTREYLARYAEDPRWLELIEGQVVVNESRVPHARVQSRLITWLSIWSAAAGHPIEAFAPVEVAISDVNHYAPDVVVTRHDPELTERQTLAHLPLICVEIRSPSTWRYDIGAKRAGYEASGLPELWLVDTEAPSILVFRRSSPEVATFDVVLEARASLSTPILPGFELDVQKLCAS